MSDFVSRLFGRGSAPTPPDQPTSEPDLTFARAATDLGTKTALHRQTWGMGEGGQWGVDLDAGIITFTNDRGWRITAPVQVVGTYNTADGTWLWGWDHPSVRPELGRDAETVRAFGEQYGLEVLTTRKVAVDEADGWQFTALACYLAQAQGGYRGPAGPTIIYLTFGGITIRKDDV
jgi:hypothetical protein